MASLFISYSRKDIETARKLTKAFEGQGLDFWIDWEEINPTQDWWREIETGIEQADNFLFLISPDSILSPVCKREIEHAVKNGKRLIPIVVRDVKSDDVPPEIRRLHWIFFRDSDVFDENLNKLIGALNTNYEWVQTHKQLQVKALEWQRANQDSSFLLQGIELQDAESQLVQNASREPHPTELQRDYVLNSRQYTDKRRRYTTITAVVVSVVMLGLAIFGFVQAKLATDRANLALARQLAAQSQNLDPNNGTTAVQSGLLAVESAKRGAGWAAYQALSQYLTFAALPKEQMDLGDSSVIALSPDGKYAITSHNDGSLYVWDIASRTEITQLESDGNESTFAVFSPDGKHIFLKGQDIPTQILETGTWAKVAESTKDVIAISPDGKYLAYGNSVYVYIQEAKTGDEIAQMKHTEHSRDYVDVTTLAFSPDGKYLVSGSANAIIRVWETPTGVEVSRARLASAPDILVFSPGGKYVVAAIRESAIMLYSKPQAPIFVLNTTTLTLVSKIVHNDYVTSLAFSSDGRYVISGSADGTARVWAAGNGIELARLADDGYVGSVAFSHDGSDAISLGSDGILRVWEARTGADVMLAANISSEVTSNSFSSDSKFIALGNHYDAVIREITTETEMIRVEHNNIVSTVAFSPDEETVVSEGGDIHVWNAKNGSEITFIENSYWTPLQQVALSPDGRRGLAVTIGFFNTVRIWDVATGKTIKTLRHESGINAARFSPDGKYIATGSQDGFVYLWETDTGSQTAKLKHDNVVFSVAFSPDGRYIVSGSLDGTARIWQIPSGVEIARLPHGGRVDSVIFSPDGRYVLSGSSDGTACVWDVNTTNEIARTKHNASVGSVIFSSDGRYVLSGSADGEVRVWEIATESVIASVNHNNQITSAVFSPNGKYIASHSNDGVVRIWLWQLDDLIDEVCLRLPRNLTHEEWKQYIGDEPYKATCPALPMEDEAQ